MASRKEKTAVERERPELREAARMAHTEEVADSIISDEADERGLMPNGHLFAHAEMEVGKNYWVEGPNWVSVGTIATIGRDYIALHPHCRVASDGRHSTFMSTGRGPSDELEPTPGRRIIPLDMIVSFEAWGFPIPREAV
jgi:hypothetical protein